MPSIMWSAVSLVMKPMSSRAFRHLANMASRMAEGHSAERSCGGSNVPEATNSS